MQEGRIKLSLSKGIHGAGRPRDHTFAMTISPSQAVTSMPIERAVPLMLLIADSRVTVLRSGIFCLAISSICFSLTLPTLSLLGVPEPFARFAAFFSSTAAGGVLVMKV